MKVLFFILIILSVYFAQEYNQSFAEPYRGEIITEQGVSFEASRISLGVKENVTQKRVEELIKPFNGRIVGWLKTLDIYTIELPASQRENAIESLKQEPEIEYAQRQYAGKIEYPTPNIFPGSATICPLGIIVALILLVLLVKKFLLRR